MWAASVTFLLMAGVRTSVKLLKHKMVLALNLHAASNLESNVRATHAKTEVFAKRAGIDSYVIALALATGHAPVREVNVSVQSCPFFVVLHKPYHTTLHTTPKSKGESQFLILTLNLKASVSKIRTPVKC